MKRSINHLALLRTLKSGASVAAVVAGILHPVSVLAQEADGPGVPAFNSREQTATESVVVVGRNYRATSLESATKTPTPILEIPQPVQVITRQLIDDQRPLTISDALKNVSGFSALRSSGEVFRSFNIRGFQTLDISVDGMRQTFGLNDQPDAIANIQQIEVLKGPSGALYGRGGLGATLNIVTKSPLPEKRISASFSTGTGGLIQPTLDATGPLNDSGSIRGRFIADYESRDTATNLVDLRRWQIAPSLEIDINDKTTLSLKSDYRDRDGLRFVALPAYGTVIGLSDIQLPYDLFIGDTTAGKAHNTGWTSTARVDHRLSDGWTLTGAARWMRNTLFLPFVNPTSLAAGNRLLNRNYREFKEVESELAFDVYVTGRFTTGSVRHTIVAGADYATFDYDSLFTSGRIGQLNITAPVYGQPITAKFVLDDTTDGIGGLGLYAQDQIDLTDDLHVLLGLRYDQVDKDRVSRVTNVTRKRSDGQVSPRIGVSYSIADGVALFGSYGTGLQGSADGASNQTGTPFRAQTSRQWEGGLKLDLFDSLSTTLALYDLSRDGVLVTDPTGTGFSVQTGKQKSTGVELDAAWQAADGLSLIATYTYMDARVTRDTTIPIGNQLANDPRHQGRLWGKYVFPETGFGTFAIALGATYQGAQQANIQNNLKLPDSLVADGGLFWERGPIGAQLNVLNLSDERYITRGALGNVGVIPGDPRRIMLAVKTVF